MIYVSANDYNIHACFYNIPAHEYIAHETWSMFLHMTKIYIHVSIIYMHMSILHMEHYP